MTPRKNPNFGKSIRVNRFNVVSSINDTCDYIWMYNNIHNIPQLEDLIEKYSSVIHQYDELTDKALSIIDPWKKIMLTLNNNISNNPYQNVYTSKTFMASKYTAFIPHIAEKMPDIDYYSIGKKAIDYGYISIIERISTIASLQAIADATYTIQEWGYIFSNLGYEFVRLGQGKVNSTTVSRAIIIDKDLTTCLIIFERADLS